MSEKPIEELALKMHELRVLAWDNMSDFDRELARYILKEFIEKSKIEEIINKLPIELIVKQLDYELEAIESGYTKPEYAHEDEYWKAPNDAKQKLLLLKKELGLED